MLAGDVLRQLPGSSPLSRGILARPFSSFHLYGIIPALAGNTTNAGANAPARWDHPRSRGEYIRGCLQYAVPSGSSPLSRGIPQTPERTPQQGGIIPALAGNTTRNTAPVMRRTDHPRSRGEYQETTNETTVPNGSSPLSRGIRRLWRRHYAIGGIIPALAGNTKGCRWGSGAATDHPRSRGEYWNDDSLLRECQGSSPLSRGIPGCLFHDSGIVGIIPALAGNTPSSTPSTTGAEDHPRSRGEYVSWWHGSVRWSGSSPLSRGILYRLFREAGTPGIIPALAGNTFTITHKGHETSDHPRSRGEYTTVPHLLPVGAGSSPLSRGILTHRHRRGQQVGIIPALAGNTRSHRRGP